MRTDYQLIAINDNAEVIVAQQFGAWVPVHEAVATIREFYPEAIAVLDAWDYRPLWAEKFVSFS